MAERLDPKETVSFEELLMSNVYTQEALINLLEMLNSFRRIKGEENDQCYKRKACKLFSRK
jgi:hypothetical protein